MAQIKLNHGFMWTTQRNPLLSLAHYEGALLFDQESQQATPLPGARDERPDVELLELQDDVTVLEDELWRLVNLRKPPKQRPTYDLATTQHCYPPLIEERNARFLADIEDSPVADLPPLILDALDRRFLQRTWPNPASMPEWAKELPKKVPLPQHKGHLDQLLKPPRTG